MRVQERISTENGPIRVAQYVRMSTEHQQYSIDNQSDWNRRYAGAHGMAVVRTYSDVKSGVSLRDGLRQLLYDVETGKADYSIVLVYDVSRWGRFQDVDESAYYEYRCKRAGVAVHYCAEQFENDGGLLSSLLKSIKRSMAGEYSRELSVKVFAGQCRLVRLGFVQGGTQGYGIRRALVDSEGNLKQVLSLGEQKSIQTDRIILVPGPEHEVKIIREIYDRFIKDKWSFRRIAAWINSRGVLTQLGTSWTESRVRDVLTNEKYVGTNIFNRRSRRLGHKTVFNPPEMWIRCENAFTPVIPPERFREAQKVIASRVKALTKPQILDRLRAFCLPTGPVPKEVIAAGKDMPSVSTYARRFGGLVQAYEMIGYRLNCDYSYVPLNRRIRERKGELSTMIVQQLQEVGASVEVTVESGLLRINDEFTATVVCARCRNHRETAGRHLWVINTRKWQGADLAIVVRLKPGNEDILDFYLFPVVDTLPAKLHLTISNNRALDAYRFQNLQLLFKMAQRTQVEAKS